MIFDNENRAREHFNKEIPIEACDKCGRWSASTADDWQDGEIVSCHVDFDRICIDCDDDESWHQENY